MDVFPNIDKPAWGLEDDPQADVDEVKMGDGYVLRRPKGINFLSESWSPSWDSLEAAVALSTHLWLKARLKITPFAWTHPVTGVVFQVICTSAKLSYNQYNDYILTATFEQDFNPV